MNGWTFAPVDITDAEGTAMLPVEGGKWFKEMSVGKSMLDYDSMLALTHFKGHQSDMWDIKTEELMERIAESTKATISFFGKNVAYINVMRNMSVSCDCEGVAAQPVVTPDVGIVASLDILAADQACIDLVYALPEESHAALIERMESRHGLRQLTYMKELNMGNDRYTLIDIDHDDRIFACRLLNCLLNCYKTLYPLYFRKSSSSVISGVWRPARAVST